MEIKKSKSVDLGSFRVPIILLGLLFTSGMILAAFTYSVPDDGGKDKNDKTRTVNSTIETADEPPKIIEPEDAPQINVPLPPSEVVEVIKDKEEPAKATTPTTLPPPMPVGVKDVVVKEEIVEYPDKEAMFPGGAAAMTRWIQEHVVYPEMARETGEQGKVYVQFVVESNGKITGVEVIRKVSGDLDREAARVVRAMPNWEPGESKAKKVKTRVRLPINFTLK